jgi:CheY-like chemotaxis protein
LSLTRSLAEAMGGTVTAASAPGQGSTFTVVLPADDSPGSDIAPNQTARVESPMDPTSAFATVLYIEDNDPNVQVIEHVVRLRPGWRLMHAALGQLGIELAQTHRPDLVLLDLHLPDMSGRDVLLALKSSPNTSGTPIAMVTADASSGAPRRLREAGADHFLTKPLDVDDVLALLDGVSPRQGRHG